MRRDLARIAGDPAATRYQAILDRYREMLADRDKLIAFLLLDEVWVRDTVPSWTAGFRDRAGASAARRGSDAQRGVGARLMCAATTLDCRTR
jgi:hypothetical protein